MYGIVLRNQNNYGINILRFSNIVYVKSKEKL